MGSGFGDGEVVGRNARLRYEDIGVGWAILNKVFNTLFQALGTDDVRVEALSFQSTFISMRSSELVGCRSILLAGRVEDKRRSVLEGVCGLQGQSGRTEVPQQHGDMCVWSLFQLLVAFALDLLTLLLDVRTVRRRHCGKSRPFLRQHANSS